LATPAVRNIAKKHSIDINKISGTGKDKRVMKEDILAFIAGKNSQPISTPSHSEPTQQTQQI
jgi:pyruvate/2-oxoglutarate dehydrogenase complex dihydrolipoamide acyltransferase (E2) component